MRVNQLLYSVLKQYQQALTQLEKAAPNPSLEPIFSLLLARDAVQEALRQAKQPPPSLLIQLAELDKRLLCQKEVIVQCEDYSQWRNTFQPPSSSWWWYFESVRDPRWWQKLDGLWKGFSITTNLPSQKQKR